MDKEEANKLKVGEMVITYRYNVTDGGICIVTEEGVKNHFDRGLPYIETDKGRIPIISIERQKDNG